MEWGQSTDAWTSPGYDVMREMKWDFRHEALKNAAKGIARLKSSPHGGTPTLCSPFLTSLLPSFFCLLLISPFLFLTCCVFVPTSPSLTLSPSSLVPSASSILLHHALLDPSLTLYSLAFLLPVSNCHPRKHSGWLMLCCLAIFAP